MARRGRFEFYNRHIITLSLVCGDGSEKPVVVCPLNFFWTIAARPNGSHLILFEAEAKLVLENWYRPRPKPITMMYGRGKFTWKVEYMT